LKGKGGFILFWRGKPLFVELFPQKWGLKGRFWNLRGGLFFFENISWGGF